MMGSGLSFNKQGKYWVPNVVIFYVSDIFTEEEAREICKKIEGNKILFSSLFSLCQVLLGDESLFISVVIDHGMMDLPKFVTDVVTVELPTDEHLQLVRTHNKGSLPERYAKMEVINLV